MRTVDELGVTTRGLRVLHQAGEPRARHYGCFMYVLRLQCADGGCLISEPLRIVSTAKHLGEDEDAVLRRLSREDDNGFERWSTSSLILWNIRVGVCTNMYESGGRKRRVTALGTRSRELMCICWLLYN